MNDFHLGEARSERKWKKGGNKGKGKKKQFFFSFSLNSSLHLPSFSFSFPLTLRVHSPLTSLVSPTASLKPSLWTNASPIRSNIVKEDCQLWNSQGMWQEKKERRKKNVISLNWIGKFENELLPAFFSLLFFLWRDRRRMKPNQTNKYGRHLKRKILLFFLNSFWNAFMIFFHVKFENWWA